MQSENPPSGQFLTEGAETSESVPSLKDVATTFGWLGLTSFGGGAVTSLIQDCVVRAKKWLTVPQFVESMALGQSLPGPIGPNIVTHIGYRMHGAAGATTALACFMLPSFLIMVGLAMLYARTQGVPAVKSVFFGLNPAVAGLVASNALGMGGAVLKTRRQRVQAVLVFTLAVFFPRLVFPLIFASVIGGALWGRMGGRSAVGKMLSGDFDGLKRLVKPVATLLTVGCLLWAVGTGLTVVLDGSGDMDDWLRLHKTSALAWVSLKLGAFTFGGGYVMVPLMEHDVVTNFEWVSHREFADGMALGQLTPGPFVITVTFVGYRVAGLLGAVVTTVCVLLVPYCLVLAAGRSLEKFHRNLYVQGALSGVAPTAIALLGAAAVTLGKTAFVGSSVVSHAVVVGIIAASAGIFMKYHPNPLYILAGCSLLGLFFAP